jgi:hypothetical protein
VHPRGYYGQQTACLQCKPGKPADDWSRWALPLLPLSLLRSVGCNWMPAAGQVGSQRANTYVVSAACGVCVCGVSIVQMSTFFSLRTRILAQFESLGVLNSPTGGAFAPSCICHGQTSPAHWTNRNWTVPTGTAESE